MTRRTTQRQRNWGAWSGDVKELRTLAKIITDSTTELRKRTLDMQAEKLEKFKEKESKSPLTLENIRGLEAFLKRAREIPDDDNVCATVKDNAETVFGTVEGVLDELDRRSTRCVIFIANPYNIMTRKPAPEFPIPAEDAIYLRIGTAERFERELVSLTVSSPDTSWARATFARLSDEIEKGVPRWSFLRKDSTHGYWLSWLIFLPLFISSMIATYPIPQSESARQGLWSLLFVAYLICSFFFRKIVDFFMPTFDIRAEGAESSGTQRIVSAMLLLASVPIGILVNMVS